MKDMVTPQLRFKRKLCGVCYFGENCPCYNSTLYWCSIKGGGGGGGGGEVVAGVLWGKVNFHFLDVITHLQWQKEAEHFLGRQFLKASPDFWLNRAINMLA